uniref:Transposase n=2 Tax=Candidatus Kentrum sp. SD TaxID=2126332 RepID=A0A450YNC4_9GAMM|nr:MAG: hypothetical protein BECKSD772F_GA0070984_11363 [Candidatus Kentron sp. SD]
MTTILQSKDYSGKAVLYMAMELSNAKWKLGFSNGSRDRSVTISAGDWKALSRQIDLAKEKLHLPEDCPVISCYEAGRDGFWIHRMLEGFGITNLISIYFPLSFINESPFNASLLAQALWFIGLTRSFASRFIEHRSESSQTAGQDRQGGCKGITAIIEAIPQW